VSTLLLERSLVVLGTKFLAWGSKGVEVVLVRGGGPLLFCL
jgi:hypothetical protein